MLVSYIHEQISYIIIKLLFHGGIYNVAVKDSMNNGAEAWTIKRKEKKKLLDRAEMRMVCWILGV
jgi:hypothetical protein